MSSSSPGEGGVGLRDIVGSLSTSPTPADEAKPLAHIGSFSFCEFAADETAGPFQISTGFGSEARLRRQWTARIEAFHYDLESPDFLTLAVALLSLDSVSAGAPATSQGKAKDN
jgi:hypothetical protein